MIYPDVRMTEDGVQIGDVMIPAVAVCGAPKITSEWGHFNKLTVTVVVNSIQIDPGTCVAGGEVE